MARRGRHVVPALPDDSSADKWTEELLKDMPDDLKRSGVGVKDFAASEDRAEFEKREDCQALLKEITRAVPVKLLLDTGLHKADVGWNKGAAALLTLVILSCLVCLIGTCCCSLQWARRATANPS